MSRKILPSLLAADLSNIAASCSFVNESGAYGFHLDVMDGLFVPNISFGFPVCQAISDNAEKPLDAHLMIADPDRYVERFAAIKGVEYISVHIEACGKSLRKVLKHIRECGVKAGIAVNPETPVEEVIPYLHDADFVLVMGVHPGFSGQRFIPECLEKVEVLSEMIASSEADCFIEFDGGVDSTNIGALEKAGVSLFVVGSAVFAANNPGKVLEELVG